MDQPSVRQLSPHLKEDPHGRNPYIRSCGSRTFITMGKIALVLGGGGFRGAFQVGALQVLKDHWHLVDNSTPPLKFDIVSGVSAGALNGLLIAQNKLDELTALWEEIGRKGVTEIYHSDFIDTRLNPDADHPALRFRLTWETFKKHFPKTSNNVLLKAIFSRKSLFRSFGKEFQQLRALADNGPLLEKIRKYAHRDHFSHCAFKCGYVSLNTGSFYSVNVCDFLSDEDFAKGVLASATMPIIWPPVDKVNVYGMLHEQCVDGGIRNVSPLRDVLDDIKNDRSPDEYTIIIINCSTGKLNHEDFAGQNIAQIALRSLSDIAITEIFNNDIREFITKNYLVKQIRDAHPEQIVYDYDFENMQRGRPLKYFKAIVIQPDPNMLGDPLTANERQIQARIDHGVYKAKMALDIHARTAAENKTTVV